MSSSRIEPSIEADSGSSCGIASAAVVLPHPDSPASPSTSPASRREIDAADGLDRAGLGLIPDVQVADLEQAHRRSRSRGLRIRSSVCPASVNPSTTSRIPMPGGMKYHHAPRPTAPLTNA